MSTWNDCCYCGKICGQIAITFAGGRIGHVECYRRFEADYQATQRRAGRWQELLDFEIKPANPPSPPVARQPAPVLEFSEPGGFSFGARAKLRKKKR